MNSAKVTVIIPTKNPGEIFKQVLNAVTAQKTSWPFEVVVVDSGSKDGTVDYVKECKQAKLIQVKATEFGHGRTRNLAISMSSGEFVAVITHDAKPVDEFWLANLVSCAESDERIAGVFGRHVAYPSSSAFTRRELELHFAGFELSPVVHLEDQLRYEIDVGYRQFLHFFSDNNALLRRSVWELIPYPDVDFAEDQAWAKLIVEAGYHKAYSKSGAVYHSHDYSLFERFQRSFDESYAFRRFFGYQISPNLKSLARSILALNRRDISYAYKAGLIRSSPWSVVHAIMDNTMRALGHYCGTMGDKLPLGVVRRISRDKKLFAQ